jgi:2,2-dialkylglycine decarboxylase (pyruvate)
VPGTYAIPAPYCYRCPLGLEPTSCQFACARVGFDLVDQQSVGELAVLMAEPIQSAGGIIEPPAGYWQAVKRMVDERGMLLVFDEAQTGLGRVGALFAFEQEGVVPDVLTLSKTLGGGIPLAATICSDALEADVQRKGFHYLTSHVSDPLAAAVGLAVLDVIAQEGLVARAAELGAYLRQQLLMLQARHEVIGDVRGRGLLQGVELVRDRATKESLGDAAVRINDRCLELGLGMNLLNRSGTTVWRVAPPLTVTRQEIDRAISIMDTALTTA